ncbi:MtrAB system histidine kinase MtrB [Bifidobacterium oedipodis]|uniref:MtrAB system histidine kinase MtrB n=1 Tax=Bifidobacterium oedipodis TaxID=2675322 RepID=UPI00145EE25C|nr:MtrAB system histidine kinase MtrB [Bifidobacterium sp. DSM 109957]
MRGQAEDHPANRPDDTSDDTSKVSPGLKRARRWLLPAQGWAELAPADAESQPKLETKPRTRTRTFSFGRLIRHGRTEVRRSLQARTVALTVALTLAVAVVFSMVSLISVRASLLSQITSQSRADYSNMVRRAQASLDAADVSTTVQIQQLVNDLASTLQSDGSSNLAGIYLWSRDSSSRAIVPISTEPTYERVISDDIRSSVASNLGSNVFYQPIELPVSSNESQESTPGAVLGTMLDFGIVGNLEFYAVYSYALQQESLMQIQVNLLAVCVLLSLVVGVVMWSAIRGIVRPVEHVAAAAKNMASGDLDARVTVNRKDELGVLQQSFNAMAVSLGHTIDELEAAGVSQKRFVSDVSHELRTPITTMRMACDLLEMKKDDFDPAARRTVELLSGQIDRFQDMLADLLEISRYDAGYAALDLVETDIREPLEAAAGQVAGIAQAKHVLIHQYLPNVQVLARIDSRRVIRIVRNLLANAVDFADDKPVDMRVAANRKAVVISVRDYGTGMAPDQLEHVFDRFWRGDSSRSRITGGTGLGLSIAMTDALLHHGTIRVRSRKGEGTWFLVILPRDPDAGAVPDADLPLNFAFDSPDDLRITGGFGVAQSRISGTDETRRDTMMGRPL